MSQLNLSKASVSKDKYLVFSVARQGFAMPLLQVQEVIGLSELRPIPGAPPYLLGVLTRRRRVIPTVDLAKLLGLEGNTTARQVTIIYRLGHELIALKVESADWVEGMSSEDIREAPPFSEVVVSRDLIAGIVERRGKLIMLLKMEACLSGILADSKKKLSA